MHNTTLETANGPSNLSALRNKTGTPSSTQNWYSTQPGTQYNNVGPQRASCPFMAAVVVVGRWAVYDMVNNISGNKPGITECTTVNTKYGQPIVTFTYSKYLVVVVLFELATNQTRQHGEHAFYGQ